MAQLFRNWSTGSFSGSNFRFALKSNSLIPRIQFMNDVTANIIINYLSFVLYISKDSAPFFSEFWSSGTLSCINLF